MRRIFGGLEAVLAGGDDGRGGGDGPVVVLCHGFGAPSDDLVGLVPLLKAPAALRFVFPGGPLLLDRLANAHAWWHIDPAVLQLGVRRPRDRAQVPEGLAEARRLLGALLDDVSVQLGVASDRVVLGGFSQGAMLSLDVALHRSARLCGLVLLSTTIIAEPLWSPLLPAGAGVAAFQAHGTEDPVLPYALAEALRDKLTAAGLPVEWMSFRGGHEIPLPVLRALGKFLGRVTKLTIG